ncbi:MAG: hypothetical protein U0M21_09450 [Emergencia sp.]|nr:hypothetical protein [Emergencia sp.]
MISNKISDDMINIMLRQMGADSIKTTPAHINIAKFFIGEDLRITYMYEVKEEEVYLQRVNPYPMMIGKIYNEQQVVDIIGMDLKKFRSAYNSSNFSQFVEVTNSVSAFVKEIENLFMSHNVAGKDLAEIEDALENLYALIKETAEKSPLLK